MARRVGEPDGFGRYGVLDVDGEGRLICHECGRSWLHLGTHIAGAHGMSSAAYREAHGLGVSTRLVSGQVRARMSESWGRVREMHEAHLIQHRDPARANVASRGRPQRPEVVAARQAAARARAGRDLTRVEVEALGDASDLRVWADAAWRLLDLPRVTKGSIARAMGEHRGTVEQRLRRYPRR